MTHRIVHWEIMGPNGEAMRDFYEDLFGWKTDPAEGFASYHLVSDTDTTIAGAVGQGAEQMPSYLTVYIEVDSVDEHLAQAESAGGTIIAPRVEIPGVVAFGMLGDPAGNMVGIVERDVPEG